MTSDANDLISFIASMSGEGNLRVEENLGDGFVKLRVSEAERRQAKHDIQHVEDIVVEMLRNARDAGAAHIYVAMSKEEGVRTLLFFDDGCGIPEDMHERVFDARVTSKLESMKMDRWGVHGRGMALFSIRQNAEEACILQSAPGLGSAFKVACDLSTLSERADQSSWPQVAKDEETGAYACVKGPHNIIRCVCEFALEEQRGCSVYVGSPTEVAATMYDHARTRLDASRLLFIDSQQELPVVDRLGYASDAADFIHIAHTLGIDISERTAHRILAGSIRPLRNVSAKLMRRREHAAEPRKIDLAQDRRGLKISRDDLATFSRALERDFADLGARYYLSLSHDPKIRVSHDKITVTFEIGKDE